MCCVFTVELLRILMRDAKDFDTTVWFYAVGVVMGAFVLLGLTVCLLLVRDWYEDDGLAGELYECEKGIGRLGVRCPYS